MPDGSPLTLHQRQNALTVAKAGYRPGVNAIDNPYPIETTEFALWRIGCIAYLSEFHPDKLVNDCDGPYCEGFLDGLGRMDGVSLVLKQPEDDTDPGPEALFYVAGWADAQVFARPSVRTTLAGLRHACNPDPLEADK